MAEFPNVDSIRSTIAQLEQNSELKQEVFDMLCSGWSPARVSRHLFKTKGVKLTPAAVRTFLDEIPPAFVLPLSLIKTKLLQLDIVVDAVGELNRLLMIQEGRVSAALLVEEVSPGGEKSITLEATRLLKEYWKSLMEFVALLQSIGELPAEPAKFDITSGGEHIPTLREMLEQKLKEGEGEGGVKSSSVE